MTNHLLYPVEILQNGVVVGFADGQRVGDNRAAAVAHRDDLVANAATRQRGETLGESYPTDLESDRRLSDWTSTM